MTTRSGGAWPPSTPWPSPTCIAWSRRGIAMPISAAHWKSSPTCRRAAASASSITSPRTTRPTTPSPACARNGSFPERVAGNRGAPAPRFPQARSVVRRGHELVVLELVDVVVVIQVRVVEVGLEILQCRVLRLVELVDLVTAQHFLSTGDAVERWVLRIAVGERRLGEDTDRDGGGKDQQTWAFHGGSEGWMAARR